eukprot:4405745-Prymnesium_polylepis.1
MERRPSGNSSARSITSSPCSQVRAPVDTRVRNHHTPCRSHRFTSSSLPPPNSLLFTPQHVSNIDPAALRTAILQIAARRL